MRTDMHNLEFVQDIATEVANTLKIKGQTYGDSWMKRGGPGAFMVTARKIDRLENIMAKHNYDVFAVLSANPEDVEDDIRDLIGYLILWLSEHRARTLNAGGKAAIPAVRSWPPSEGNAAKLAEQRNLTGVAGHMWPEPGMTRHHLPDFPPPMPPADLPQHVNQPWTSPPVPKGPVTLPEDNN